MKILLLGGSGFIGSSLTLKLVSSGHSVTILDHRAMPESFKGLVKYYRGDYRDSLLVTELLQQVEVVVHLACSSVPSTANLDPVFDLEANLLPTVRLMELVRKSGDKYVAFFSSGGAVYGDASVIPTPEECRFDPKSAYGAMKAASELYIQMLGRLYGLNCLILRPSNPYGPRQSGDGVQGAIAAFVESAVAGKTITLIGDGETKRDFIYIDDLIDGVTKAIETRCVGTMNFGSGKSTSINEVLDCVVAATGAHLDIVRRDGRGYDVQESLLDITRARSTLAWEPRTSIREGLARVVEERRQRKNGSYRR